MDMFGLRPVQYASNVQRKVYYVPTLQRLQAAAELPDEWSDYLGREALDLGQDVNNMSFATWMKKFVQIGPK